MFIGTHCSVIKLGSKNYNCHFDSQMQKFNINDVAQSTSLSSLAAAQPGSVQQMIQLNYTYFIFVSVKLKDKYYFLLI